MQALLSFALCSTHASCIMLIEEVLLTHNFFIFISVNLEESEFLIATSGHEHPSGWMELDSYEKEKQYDNQASDN